ncbi:MAG: type IX secretion system sortase PorU [Bacteroides sp.]|nr:type IX secretion system sortase PorU [Roseburia sp.]MCM1346224.1 type IX secretion system sortase PorU [Bacteroides sp.]MCM1420701.1 type IX secretion system sortase PorU [Bacteroides sp.]
MDKRLYALIPLLLLPIFIHAQFIDIEWTKTDTIVPRYTETFVLGEDFRLYDYSFEMEYQESIPATKEEIKRYNIDLNTLKKGFHADTSTGISRKKGVLNVEVYPFAWQDGKVVKLTSFKPVVKKSIKQAASKTQLSYRIATQNNASTDSRYAEHSLLASGRWIKIKVSSAGIYELTKSKLSSLGFNNPSRVHLYGYNLPVLPETNIENISDDLTEIPLWRKDNGALLFYSCGTTKWTRTQASEFTHFNNPYSKDIYYFLTESTDATTAEFPVESYEESSVDVETFYDYSVIEADEYSFLNSGRTFFESYDYANGNKRNYKLELPGIASPNAILYTQFAAAGSSTSRLDISCGETTLGSMSFTPLAEYYYGNISSRKTNWSSATESNTLTLTHTRNSGTSGHLDYIRASYLRKLEMTGNYLVFRPTSSGTANYKISGATSSTRVWRVTTPAATCEIKGIWANGIYSATATSAQWNQDEFVAVNIDKTYPSPDIVGQIQNQDLHSLSDIDFVIITPANGALTAQAQRLADAHTAKEGMRCYVTTADKIYNEFSSGTPDATAYRRFMKMLYDKAETDDNAPKNLLLFGCGLWDNRFVTFGMRRYSQDDYLLCYESDNSLSTLNSYVCEEYFGMLDDGEGSRILYDKSDIGVGRIPVTTANEAKIVVDKLISYINNEETGSWKNTICFLADDGNGNTHMRDADNVRASTISKYPDYNYRRIFWDSYVRVSTATGQSYPDAYTDINKQMLDGALIMNYVGHGASYCLSHEQVLKRADFANWTSPKLPLWITAACDVSPFDMNEENIGTTALLNKKGAAMGMVTTTRTTYSSDNQLFNRQFMQYVLGKKENGTRYTIGEAVQMAKNASASGRVENKTFFVLLGDPAITLATPQYKIKIDSFNGADTDLPQNISAGSIVSIEGHVVDEDGNIAENFNGTVSPTIYDSMEKVQCRYNAQNDQEEEKYNASPYSYSEYTRTLYTGEDSVRNGTFKISFPVPLDINYSNEAGLASIYAASSDKDIEAQGQFENFTVGGTSPDISLDTSGPEISVFLNTENFQPGDRVNESPMLIAYFSDDDGINTTGNGIGHDITLIIDNSESMSYSLNSYFNTEVGNYTKGSVRFSIPSLPAGKHTLQLRAFDILNNPSVKEVDFTVVESLPPTIFELACASPVRQNAVFTITNDRPQSELDVNLCVYDISGRKVWETNEIETSLTNVYTYTWNLSTSDNSLQPGIYICKATIRTADGGEATKAVKFIVLSNITSTTE